MTTSAVDQRPRTLGSRADGSLIPMARAYFASDSRRIVQTVLGLIWLLDGALQFQSLIPFDSRAASPGVLKARSQSA